MLNFAALCLVIAVNILLKLSTTEGLLFSSYINGNCIQSSNATIVKLSKKECLGIQVDWSVNKKVLKKLNGFQLSLMTGSGQSSSLFLKKKVSSYLIELPNEFARPEQYTIHVDCLPKTKSSKKTIIDSKDICNAYFQYRIPAPFHCLKSLENVSTRKCNKRKIHITWNNPSVSGYSGYLVRRAKVNCKDGESCCQDAEYQQTYEIAHNSHNVTLTGLHDETQYCIEILMCPVSHTELLNCEAKYPPIFVKCSGSRHHYPLLIGTVAVLLLFFCLVTAYCIVRFKRRRRESANSKMKTASATKRLLKNKHEGVKESKLYEPLLLIVYCAGCLVIEEYVLHLTRFFRQNGIKAVSELTEEEAVNKHGRGVYLNKMLGDADFVFVLCTEVMDNVSCQNSYVYIQKTIQNRIIEQGNDLCQYLMAHFSNIDNVPVILRSAGLDLNGDVIKILEKVVLRIFGVKTFCVDQEALHKNEVQFCKETFTEIDALANCAKRLVMPWHPDCCYDSCQKGKKKF